MEAESEIVTKKLKSMSNEFEVGMEDMRQLFYEDFYKLQAENPNKNNYWLRAHALTLVNRSLTNPTRIKLNMNPEQKKDKKITIRVTEDMRDKIKERCDKENSSVSKEMRKLIKKWLE